MELPSHLTEQLKLWLMFAVAKLVNLDVVNLFDVILFLDVLVVWYMSLWRTSYDSKEGLSDLHNRTKPYGCSFRMEKMRRSLTYTCHMKDKWLISFFDFGGLGTMQVLFADRLVWKFFYLVFTNSRVVIFHYFSLALTNSHMSDWVPPPLRNKC